MLSRTCLVVDDDPAVRAFVTVIVARREFRALHAEDGVKALRLALDLGEALDLVVSDLEMPGGDGLTFIRSLRTSYPAVPVVVISGTSTLDPGTYSGLFCELLEKPFSPKKLLDAIDRAIRAGATS